MAAWQSDAVFARHHPKVAAVSPNDVLSFRVRRACLEDVTIRAIEVLRNLRSQEVRCRASKHGVGG